MVLHAKENIDVWNHKVAFRWVKHDKEESVVHERQLTNLCAIHADEDTIVV